MNLSDELKDAPVGWTAEIVKIFLTSKLSLLFLLGSLLAGGAALLVTPREEDPQIVVPVIDVFVAMPGASAVEVERLAAGPLETILKEIPGVENVYTISRPGSLMATVRFLVGQDRERSLTKVMTQLEANRGRVPPGIQGWQIVPVDIDDVPVVSLALTSRTLDDAALRAVARELLQDLRRIPFVGKSQVIGGRPREVRVLMDPVRLAGYNLSAREVLGALQAANLALPSGEIQSGEQSVVHTGAFLRDALDVARVVVGVHEGVPVYCSQVAEIVDGPAEPTTYTRIGFGPHGDPPAGWDGAREYPAVTLALAKQKGANAVAVASAIIARAESLKGSIIPTDVEVRATRDYGESANHKVNELVLHLTIAVLTIIVLLGLSLGWKEAFVVALAVPMTLAITLLVGWMAGYTINRVTLFALILSLGLLVDDPIVDVENIFRHFKLRKFPPLLATLVAVDEIRPPTILATFTVIVSFLPTMFLTGMMGPYMAPMAFNVPVVMLMSLVVAFTVTPWAAYHVLKGEYDIPSPPFDLKATMTWKFYDRVLGHFFRRPSHALLFLGFVLVALLASLALAALGFVPLKMLPFGNKNELQLVVEMPESATLEKTDAVLGALGDYVRTIPEVRDYATYAGTTGPTDFNGLVRHYFLRAGSNVADMRINLLKAEEREWQSHAIALRMRPEVTRIAAEHGAIVKIVESPPGPPVLASIVAEVYGPPGVDYGKLVEVAREVRAGMQATESIHEVDWVIEDPLRRYDIVVDREKAALSGVNYGDALAAARVALGGGEAGSLRDAGDREPTAIRLRLPQADRGTLEAVMATPVRSSAPSPGGPPTLVRLGDLAHIEERVEETSIYHKDVRPVVFVTAEPIGVSPVDGMFAARRIVKVPDGFEVNWQGEGEWKLTVEVFRDLGLAFAAALLFIYILLVGQTGSLVVPVVIMIAIPLTVIGIFPGFALLNTFFSHPVAGAANPIFFTATGMIGMIALAGIVVRNSIILIDFIGVLRREGKRLEEAIIEAGATRTRPIFLTAGAALFGSWVIVLDPIFSALAWSFIFGIFASTGFTLIVIPLIYWFMERGREGQ